MKRPNPSDRRPAASPGSQSVDETMIDMSRPAGPGSVGQQAGRSALQVAIATDIGRVRHNNEDYVQAERVVRDGRRYSMWAVADGVGGGPKGELASKTAVETIVDYLAHEPWADPSVALTEAFALANRNVYEITGEGSAASTMVAALVSEPEGMVCIANVGDSRAYIVVGGVARQITDDHSIVAARVAAGQISAAEARTAPDRNVLTRSIGSEAETLVDIFGPRQLQPNERLVLCTDGVHGMIDDAAIGRIGSGHPIHESAGALVAAAVEAGGKDNATALVGGFAGGAALLAAAPIMVGAVAASTARTGDRPPRRVLLVAGVGLLVLALLAMLAFGAFASSPAATASPSPSPSPAAGQSPSATTVASVLAPIPSAVVTPSPVVTRAPARAPTNKPAPIITQTPAATTPAPIITQTPAATTPAPTITQTPAALHVAPPPNPFPAKPGEVLFEVTYIKGASCTFLAHTGDGTALAPPPELQLVHQEYAREYGGSGWSISSGTMVTVTVTCTTADGQSTAATTVAWP